MMDLNCLAVLILWQIFKMVLDKHETLTAISPIHVHLNRISNRLVFKIKNGYKLELQKLQIWNYLAAQKINRQKKVWRNLTESGSSWSNSSSM